ncbi:hypothetical protein [Mesorhizobium ciceri]|uniref:hypothetical protein n=1 Tax=Mesorhizobium ciceri TaxID=39645 RepID=UPI003756A5C7
MTKHRLGTIQSFRPGYGALMPQSTLYGKRVADFQRPDHGNIVLNAIPKRRDIGLNAIQGMARAAGLEPTTCGFGDRISFTHLSVYKAIYDAFGIDVQGFV